MSAPRYLGPANERRALIAKAHVAAHSLGLDDDTRRAVQSSVTGHESCGTMSVPELERLLTHYRGQGWVPKGQRPKASSNPQARKVRALWGALVRAGVVQAAAPGPALRAFCERMTGVAAPEWLRGEQAVVVIEALKAWLARGRKGEG